MASVALPARRKTTARNYLNAATTVKSWLLTTDHKRIAILYLISISVMFVLGGAAAGLIRLQLLTPNNSLLTYDAYNKSFTMHGVIMVFFFLIPSIPAVLGNFILPMQLGAKDLAFPRLNLLSWYVYMIGAIFTLVALLWGGVDTGWTFYTPYSTQYSATAVIPVGLGVFIVGFSSILTGLNFIATVHTMRAPGLTWFRLPLFIWALYATSLVIMLGTPVISITVLMIAIDRILHVGIFDPALGGDPLLFQHLFWFYSHPAVYIMILPTMGVISEVFATFSRKPVFGYPFVAMSSLAIAILGFLVWAHHMFVAGISAQSALIFSFLTYLVAIPSAVKTFNWTATLYKGSISLDTPMIYALCFIGIFLIGGFTGLFLASLGTDIHLTMTYFIVAHFHYIMVGGAIFGFLAGMHYWWPKMTGKMYSEFWGRISAVIIFVGFNMTFFPQFIAGYWGMPRRYHTYAPEYQILNVMSTAGATILAVGYVLPVIYLLASLRNGKPAGNNPWGATTLEWQTSSPPPTYNFLKTPIVTEPVYHFHLPAPDIAVDGHADGQALGPGATPVTPALPAKTTDEG